VIELITPDLDSGKISSDTSVHLYEFKPAINPYLVSGNAPVKSLEEIISSAKFHPNILPQGRFGHMLKLAGTRRLPCGRRIAHRTIDNYRGDQHESS
jgi:hypothetical protein